LNVFLESIFARLFTDPIRFNPRIAALTSHLYRNTIYMRCKEDDRAAATFDKDIHE
jgi:hypothetical protein